MTRILTTARRAQIDAARAADPEALGPKIAGFVTDGNVPVGIIATMLAVSEVTIYRWMYGDASPRDADKVRKIKRLITVLNKAQRAGDLPLSGTVPERMKRTEFLIRQYKPQPKATT
jgi:hypothetical protein